MTSLYSTNCLHELFKTYQVIVKMYARQTIWDVYTDSSADTDCVNSNHSLTSRNWISKELTPL